MKEENSIEPISKDEFISMATMYKKKDAEKIWNDCLKKEKVVGLIDGELGYMRISTLDIKKQNIYEMAWDAGVRNCYRIFYASILFCFIFRIFCTKKKYMKMK